MIKKILISSLLLFLIVLGLFWLSAAILLFIVTYSIISHYIKLIKHSFLKKTIKCIVVFLFLLSSLIFSRMLILDLFRIPSSSMENLFYPGDIIVVNKLKYGPKLPRSPFDIPFINLAFYNNKNALSRIKSNWWNYNRLAGTTNVKRGDVFVFSLDISRKYFVVKRCVGLPGDTIKIIKGEVYANSTLYNSPETVKNSCNFRLKNKKKFFTIIDSLKIEENLIYDNSSPNWASGIFSKHELQILQKMNCIDSIKKNIDHLNVAQEELLKTTDSRWTLDDMGPIIIPKKGMEIDLNPDNFLLYKKIFNLFENSIIIQRNGIYFIDGEKETTYKFKLNYYFMMGDNRKGTSDSRSWGFLPESNVIGKVQCVLFSNKNK
ncbi:signal peptidase I [Flavobacterium chungangense]|uniref:Signal peptidase I n=1 Tax=Flavobacterium chungangense TaxID=554283 RepID=A0A6V6ZDN0_9FLAO|nr:signal peptidase I [Flavobacterium chungangense]CAD0009890.1 S26 family signal peptidase [Flavobacterium chungangense]